jgi:exopolysaccharide biosynthesis polyprenyl glycosylphosphotransferase
LYSHRKIWSYAEEIKRIIYSLFSFFIATSIVLFAFKYDISRLFVGYFFVALAILTITFRIVLRAFLEWVRKKGFNTRFVLVIGAGERGRKFAQELNSLPQLGYKILAFVDDDEKLRYTYVEGIPVAGTIKELASFLHNNVVDEVVVALPFTAIDKINWIANVCELEGKSIRIMMDFIETRIAKGQLTSLGDIPIMHLNPVPVDGLKQAAKRIFDFCFSFCVLVFMLPLFLLIALLIKLDSPGPVFFAQERVGLQGRRFKVLKFRTMVVNAEELLEKVKHLNEVSGPVFKITNDPRITRVGKFLRKTSLDELPQFINVLLGDMSVVGPRPPLPREVAQYDAWQRRRLSVKPGITCIWQTSGRNDIPFEKWMEMDLEYIDNWNFWLDLKLIFKTIVSIVSLTGK